MNILVIGSGGTGSIIAKTLAGFDSVSKVILGDINEKNAKKFFVADSKIDFRIIDATKKENVLEILKDCSLLINAATPNFNTKLMEIALEAGVNYQDLASAGEGVSVDTIEQFDYDEKFKEKGLVALINSSATPGVSNLMVGELASRFENVESIKIRLLENVQSDAPLIAWSKEVAFDELISLPHIWNGNKFVPKENFDEKESFDFPAPFGKTKCYMIAQEDISTIPRFIKSNYIDIKAGGSEIEFGRALFQLGFMNQVKMKVGEASLSPYEFLVKVWPDVSGLEEVKKLISSGQLHDANFWASVEVSDADKKKKNLRAYILFPSQLDINKIYPGANYVSYAAGLCAAIFAEVIPKLQRKGVYSPEAIDAKDREIILEKLKKSGVKIEISEI